ncbi:MAG: hypothetical protein ACXAEI_16335 [Candidatus Hodarchaeales archaeon]|jgi:hypothetical protein
MTAEKKGPGRPRKYKTDADRKRAYRERQKTKINELETRVEELERELQTVDEMESRRTPVIKELHEEITFPFMKFTPSEIAEMETEQLRRYSALLQRNISSTPPGSILSPVRELIRGSSKDPDPEDASKDLDMSYLDVTRQDRAIRLAEDLQQIVLIYLIEAELARRHRDYSAIGKLERRIEELEREQQQKTKTNNN